MEYPSQLLTNAVDEFAKLPGVGRKTALRLVLHLLRQEPARALQLGESLIRLRNEVHYCRVCHNISDSEVCSICSNPQRDAGIICVVENVKEVMIVEATRQFGGLYHVLGGLISPMDGVGPQQLQIDSLVERIRAAKPTSTPVREVILALSTTMEGDTTNFYIFRKLAEFPDLRITTLARGVAVGDELEYADEITLGKSILNRTLFTDSFAKQP
ncbi:MAG: recombination mediator RecR [Bacteroidales bacterium]|jgi:recombination protein RecR|nr:recombination protein RecR [Bacteroidales bacterium]MCR5361117.1 recombination mediator RecR [Bacteroidales bacterium]